MLEKEMGEGNFSLELNAEGKIVLGAEYAGKGATAGLNIVLEPDYFIDKLAAAIPGTIDDAVLNLLKGALKG